MLKKKVTKEIILVLEMIRMTLEWILTVERRKSTSDGASRGASSLADSGSGCPRRHTPHAGGSALWDFLDVNFQAFSVEKQRHSE